MLRGFSLMELMVGLLLSSILLIGFTLLGSGIWGQLSYEDVHEKVQRYGNYVLDNMADEFNRPDVSGIRIDSFDGFSVVRVESLENLDVKYSVNNMGSNYIHENLPMHQVLKNNNPIHEADSLPNHYYNEFENKGYAVTISKFKCNQIGTPGGTSIGKYGGVAGAIKEATYIVDMQIEIYKKTGDSMNLYNTIDFQRTLFAKNEFISKVALYTPVDFQKILFVKNEFI